MVIFLFTSCSDENAFSSINDDFEDFAGEASNDIEQKGKCELGTSSYSDSWCCENYGYQCSYSSSSSYNSEAEKCRLGTSSYSDSWCCTNYGYQCNAGSSSSYSWFYSSSSSSPNYLEEPKNIYFALTYFHATTSWDGGLTTSDPEISFTIKAVTAYGDTLKKISTGKLLDKTDVNTWSGTSVYKDTIPVYTERIVVCPTVKDEEPLGYTDFSSGYCYIISNIGRLSNYSSQNQSDYKNEDCELEWHWYLY
ncbi:hypothetical protein [uncultured Fibrobacter sp.]|uniref:hypothetical protein n=1 Tax=uncultured Fibrobacter sp. TaxID=261512 RepID=UPI0028064D28|nr:hypothetical protein [uncultured Fibrobacter sp.]